MTAYFTRCNTVIDMIVNCYNWMNYSMLTFISINQIRFIDLFLNICKTVKKRAKHGCFLIEVQFSILGINKFDQNRNF